MAEPLCFCCGSSRVFSWVLAGVSSFMTLVKWMQDDRSTHQAATLGAFLKSFGQRRVASGRSHTTREKRLHRSSLCCMAGKAQLCSATGISRTCFAAALLTSLFGFLSGCSNALRAVLCKMMQSDFGEAGYNQQC